jgi:hypothetical protein
LIPALDRRKVRPVDESATVKRCPCPEHEGARELPASKFSKNRSTSDGLAGWCRVCTQRQRARANDLIRDQVFGHYGRVCACPGCGATDKLTIDHIDGNGAAHRAEIFGRQRGGVWFYRWLIAQGFPDGYQVLCDLCNSSKRTGAACRLDHSGQAGVRNCPCPAHEGPNPVPLDAFSKNWRSKSGLGSWCKACELAAWHRRYGAQSAS